MFENLKIVGINKYYFILINSRLLEKLSVLSLRELVKDYGQVYKVKVLYVVWFYQ